MVLFVTRVKTVISLAGFVLVAGLVSQLLLFLAEAGAGGPDFMSLRITNVTYSDNGVEAVVMLNYTGSVPLSDVTVMMDKVTIHFGDVTPGVHMKRVVLPSANVGGSVVVTFSVNDLFPFRLNITRVGS